MKPKEFDDLVRNKFDQNDFAYEPKNWDKLAEKLDGTKRRSLISLWWIPLAGMAASLLMAMGVTSLMHQQNSSPAANTAYTQAPSHVENTPVAFAQQNTTPSHSQNKVANNKPHKSSSDPVKDNTDQWFAIRYQNATVASNTTTPKKNFTSLESGAPEVKLKTAAANEPRPTFKPEEEIKKAPKLSIILSGGVNHGNQNSGYIAGATIRRMISDKLYVESDLGFASSTNTQATDISVATTSRMTNTSIAARASTTRTTAGSAGKVSAVESMTSSETTTYNTQQRDISYNLNYAQISPSIGYKLMKRISIGAGPDFQQMLVDARPTPSALDRGNIQEAPIFDVGFIGKTEYTITKKIKAGVYYRKGLNDLISPSDKYINRDYLQFQLKCVIFNK